MTVPPVKSTPRFSPLVTRKNTDTINVTREMVVVYFPQLMKGMSRLNLKNSIDDPYSLKRYASSLSTLVGHRLPHLSDGNPLQFAAAAVYQIDESARDHHRAEHGSQNTQAQYDGKSLYRTRPERKQSDTRNQGS